MRCRSVAAVLALPLLTASCGLPPTTEDVRIGRDVADSMIEQVGVYRDDRLDPWLENLGDHLAAQLPGSAFDYEFHILDQPEPNAFAAPGGYVFISRGLLAVAGSEDEIAAVVGHEITHVEHRHSMRQLTRTTLPDVLAMPGRFISRTLSEDLGNFLSSPFDSLAALRAASYGRDQEREADDLGQRIAADAGYDPAALATILTDMDALLEQLVDELPEQSYFDSHPPTAERTESIVRRAAELNPGPRPADALDPRAFHELLDGLVWGPNPARGVLDGERFLQPSLGVALQLPVGWDFVRTADLAGAVKPDNESWIFYGDVGPGSAEDIETLVQAHREANEAESGRRPDIDEPREFESGRKAHVLVYSDGEGADAVHTFFVWVPMRGRIHRLVGVGREADREILRGVVRSLRPMTMREHLSIRVQRVRSTVAREGETVADLASRSDNVATAAVLAAINGRSPDDELAAGTPVKIIVDEPLLPIR